MTFAQQFPIVFNAMNVGFLQTLKLFAVTLIGAIPLGLLISFGSMNSWTPFKRLGYIHKKSHGKDKLYRFCVSFKPISLLVRTIVWLFRGSPLMLQLLIIYYFPGLYLGLFSFWPSGEAGRFIASAVAFIINYACYFSEIYRGGIESIPKGQYEAGYVLGLKKSQIFSKIVLKQVIQRIIPPMGNEVITLVKDTSLARIIALQEVMWAGQAFLKGSQGISGEIWPLFFTGIYYLAFTGIVTLALSAIEKKLGYIKS